MRQSGIGLISEREISKERVRGDMKENKQNLENWVSVKILSSFIKDQIEKRRAMSLKDAEKAVLDEINNEILSWINQKKSKNLSEQAYARDTGWSGVVFPFISAYR